MNTVLTQEIIRYNRLLNMIHTSLQELLKAMKGLVVLSQALEEMSKSLFNNAVPVMWSKVVCFLLVLLFYICKINLVLFA
jgi:dynein heavy chain